MEPPFAPMHYAPNYGPALSSSAPFLSLIFPVYADRSTSRFNAAIASLVEMDICHDRYRRPELRISCFPMARSKRDPYQFASLCKSHPRRTAQGLKRCFIMLSTRTGELPPMKTSDLNIFSASHIYRPPDYLMNSLIMSFPVTRIIREIRIKNPL